AGRVPGPIARCALFGDGNGDGHLATPHRQLERDLHRILDVPSPLRRGPRPRPGPPPELEDRAEQVAEPADVRQVVEVEPAAPPGLRARPRPAGGREIEPSQTAELPQPVVLLPLLRVGED